MYFSYCPQTDLCRNVPKTVWCSAGNCQCLCCLSVSGFVGVPFEGQLYKIVGDKSHVVECAVMAV